MTIKNKINLSVITFFGLAVLLILFLIYPFLKDIENIGQEFILKKQEIIFLENKIKEMKRFRENYPEIKSNLEKIDSSFVESEMPLDFINFLEKTAKELKLSVEISPAVVKNSQTDFWPSIAFQINSVGSFPLLLKFIDKLETGSYLIEMQDLNISRLSETQLKTKEFEKFSLGDVKANFSIKVFSK